MGRTIKVDITEKVVAKFKNHYLELYSNKFMIGKYYMNSENKHYVLENGYIFENGRFYRLIDTRRDVNPSVRRSDVRWCLDDTSKSI